MPSPAGPTITQLNFWPLIIRHVSQAEAEPETAAKCVKISRGDEKLNATLGTHRSSMKFNMRRVRFGHWEHIHIHTQTHTQ